MIDFGPVTREEVKFADFARTFTVADLRAQTNASTARLYTFVADATDAEIAFIPHDPVANDPYAATEAERHIGWSLGHLVAHVTASSEESAAIASLLARGVPYGREPRLRYETPWKHMTTWQRAVQRIEESRRIRLGYLDAFPDEPNLTLVQENSERFVARFGELNAIGRFLMGLQHEIGHYEQFREVARQAREAVQSGA
jgi:hypothetical protein